MRRSARREETLSHASSREHQFGAYLTGAGLAVTPQKAVGPYNIDFAVGAIAVEILGGGWHAYKPEHQKRTPYILNQGWHMLFVWDLKKAPLCVEAAEYVVAFAKNASGNPSAIREYRVIRGDGQLMTRGSADDDQFPLVPPSIANFGGRPID
jgi:very-short-patch-repair endonuclease